MADNEDVVIKLSADTKDAIRSLKEMERQVDKLGDLADQGEHQQRGFLSPKQVQMYKRILREMETTYNGHLRRLESVQSKYDARNEREEIRKLKRLEDNLKKREDLLRNAEGGNRWGETASPNVQEYHRQKLEEAQQELISYQNSDELKSAIEEISGLESEIESLSSAVQNLSQELDRGKRQGNRIDQLHQQDPALRRQLDGLMSALGSTGAITSVGAYMNYSGSGIDLLRQQEMSSAGITQKLGNLGYDEADSAHRETAQIVGESNQYGLLDTLALQGALARGGITDQASLNADTDTAQKFGRAYAVDPNQLAMQGSMLRHMGTLEEGQMQRFAQLIGGAVAKNGMGGREEEMLRATSALANSVGQGLAELTNAQLGNIVGLQTQLGDGVGSLRGERGANLLANMDNAIKTGDSQFDLLMGKGTEFVGLEGMLELEKLKEQGLANPENLQRILQNSERMFGSIDSPMTKFALKEKLGVNINEFEAMNKAGLLEKWKNGEFASAEELRKVGADDMADQLEQWDGTATKEWRNVEAQGENLQADHAKVYEETATGARTLWHGMPNWMQHMALPMAGIGGMGAGLLLRSKLGRGLKDNLIKRINPNIGGQGGLWNALKSRFSGLGGMGGAGGSVAGGTAGTTALAGGTAGSRLLGGVSEAVKLGGKRLPVIGGAVTAGVDQMANPEHSWGRSLAKGAGSAVGGVLGAGLAIGSGFFTGGAGWLGTGAMAVGGGIAGEKAGDALYSLFAGDEDTKPVEAKTQPTTQSDTSEGTIGELDVDTINIKDKAFADYFEKSREGGVGVDGRLKGVQPEHTIKVIIDGKIDGMSKENEDEVTSSIKDYFTGLSGNVGLNLSLSQYRR